MINKKEAASLRFSNLVAELAQTDAFQIDPAKLELSEQIYQAMLKQAISEAELSRRLGVSRAYINKILQGNVNFTIDTIVKISRALNHKFEFRLVDQTPSKDVLEAEIIMLPTVTFLPVQNATATAKAGKPTRQRKRRDVEPEALAK